MTSFPALPFQIEPMRSADIAEVVPLEQAAYGRHWGRKDYAYELESNKLAHYFVMRLPQKSDKLLGHAGFWLIAGEIHLNTIAIEPRWQRLGLSEWLLLRVIEAGQTMQASQATLEVRVSNQAGLGLYHKFGFKEVGRRRHYYQDNGEDALILTTPDLTSREYQALLQQRKMALNEQLPALIDKINQLA